MNFQDFMFPVVGYIEWMELMHDMDVLSRQDCITEQQWRDEFRSWVDSGPEGGAA